MLSSPKNPDTKGPAEAHLILQYEDEIWTINLKKAGQSSPVLDPESHEMKKRFIVRKPFDTSQVYCLASRGTRDEVLRIKLDADHPEGFKCETVYESSNAKILALEPDPENCSQIFVLDEEHRVTLLRDKNENDLTSKV